MSESMKVDAIKLPVPCPTSELTALGRKHNVVITSKYTWYNFIPKCLFLQFKRFTNTFFLIMVILMGLGYYVPTLFLSPYQPWGTFMVLVFVLAVTFSFEGADDMRRHNADRVTNKRTAHVLRRSHGEKCGTVENPQNVQWGDLVPGDIIYVENRELVPADIVILDSSSKGKCYIETSGIDGETNLKIKEMPTSLREAVAACNGWETLLDNTTGIEYDAPSSILSFTGALKTHEGRVPLDFNGLILRGSELRNTNWIVALVVYAGDETKLVMSSRATPSKFSVLDKLVNKMMWRMMILYLVLTIVCDVALLVGFPDTDTFWYFKNTSSVGEFVLPGWLAYLFTFSLLFSNLIPIDILVCLEMANMAQAWFINSDVRMYHDETDTPAEVKTTNLVAELGQITHVFSDKTGTLTRNEMRLVGVSINGERYGFAPSLPLCDVNSESVEVVVQKTADGSEHKTSMSSPKPEGVQNSRQSIVGARGSIPNKITFAEQIRRSEDLAKFQVQLFQSMIELVHGKKTSNDKSDAIAEVSPCGSLDENNTTCESKLSTIVESPGKSDSTTDIQKRELDLELKEFDTSPNNSYGKDHDNLPLDLNLSHETRAQRDEVIQFLVLLAVCHTVVIDHDSDGNVRYNAEGPDEEALVSAAATFGYRLVSTDDQISVLHIDSGGECKFRILAINAFNSDRKRMSVIAQQISEVEDTKCSYYIFAKGADNVMFERLDTKDQQVIDRQMKLKYHLDSYAECGLRTLVMGQRPIESQELLPWLEEYKNAQAETGIARSIALAEVANKVEHSFQLVGASAIEDKLQDGVPEAIHSIRSAGVTLWVLTGDKVETAVNIAFSAKLLDSSMYQFQLLEGTQQELISEIDQFLSLLQSVGHETSSKEIDAKQQQIDNADVFVAEGLALVVTGSVIEALVEDQNGTEETQRKFLQLLKSCKVVLGCRVSPVQKALIVRIVSNGPRGVNEPRPISLAIGDGANDVAMIQEAKVGVGISGKEGLQAVNSADFSIAQFRFLTRLMLVHGRWNYRRNIKMLHYVTFSWMVLTFLLFIFLLYCLMSGQQLYFETFYVTLFAWLCNAEIVAVTWFDRDLRQESVIRFPDSYVNGRLNLDMRMSTVLVTIFRAIGYTVVLWIAHIVMLPPDADLQGLGTSSYLGLVVAMTFRQAWLTYTIVWIVLLAFAFVILATALALAVFGPFAYTVTASYTWLPTLWAVVVLYLLEIVFVRMPQLYVPSDLDVMIELDRGYIMGVLSTPRAVFDALHVFGQTARHMTFGPILIPASRVKRAVETARKRGMLRSLHKLSARSGFDFAAVNDGTESRPSPGSREVTGLPSRVLRTISNLALRRSSSPQRSTHTSQSGARKGAPVVAQGEASVDK